MNFVACPLCAQLAALFAVLSLPLFAFAQDEEGRFVAVLDVAGKDAGKVPEEFQAIVADSPHILYNQADLVAAGERNGVSDPAFWNDPTQLATVGNAEGIDALVMPELRKEKKKFFLTVTVFNARDGSIVDQFEIELGKKAKIGDAEAASIKDQLRPLIAKTGAPEPPPVVKITVRVSSEPQGAVVLRDGKSIGNTPLSLELEKAEGTEMWELTYQSKPAGFVKVDLAKDGTYSVTVPPEVLDAIADEEPSSTGALPLGIARPILEIGANVIMTGRSLDVSVSQGNSLAYTSSFFPTFTGDLSFFPFPLFSDNDYLAGIGLIANGGWGSLESRIPFTGTLASDSTCKGTDDPSLISCPTNHTQFQVGGIYRLLLNDGPTDEQGNAHLDPNGMAVSLRVAYSWLVFDVDKNPTYEGHGYQGIRVGADFGMPLGLDPLRAEAGFAYTQALSFGSSDMIMNWGEEASGWGIGANVGISYEIIAGLFAKLVYDFNYFGTSYEGTGCQDANCTLPTGAAATDMFNQIGLQVGYRLH